MKTTPTANHVIEAKRDRYNQGFEPKQEDMYILIPELHNHYFAIAHKDKGRMVYQGPILENIVFVYARASFIDNHGGMPAAIQRAGSITVKLGETISFIGRTFRVEDEGDHYNAKLVEVL